MVNGCPKSIQSHYNEFNTILERRYSSVYICFDNLYLSDQYYYIIYIHSGVYIQHIYNILYIFIYIEYYCLRPLIDVCFPPLFAECFPLLGGSSSKT